MNPTPNRHTACGGIHGEWSANDTDRPITKVQLMLGIVAMLVMYLAMCIGAAYGF